MQIKALKALTIRVSESGDLVGSEDEAIGKLVSIAHGAIAEVPDTVGQSLIEDGLAEVYEGNMTSFGKWVQSTITRVTADMLEGVNSIGDSAFLGCSSLTSIEIPNSVTSISNYAFSGCISLTSIEMPNSVTNLGTYVFKNCKSLANVKISNSVTSLGTHTFDNCSSLTSLEIPNSVTEINTAFYDCSSLTSITVLATTPPTVSYMFNGVPIRVIYVPAESVETYKTANGWKGYANKIQAIPS